MAKSSVKGKKRVKFSLKVDASCEVYVAGTFNGWDPQKHNLTYGDGVHSTVVLLSPGRYEYKFIVADKWRIDPECTEWAPDGHGSLNSVIVVE